MRALWIFGCLSVGFGLVAGCGGESSGPDEGSGPPDSMAGEGGASSSPTDGGASGATDEPGSGTGGGKGGTPATGGTATTGGMATTGGTAPMGGASMGAGPGAPGGAASTPVPPPKGCEVSDQMNSGKSCQLGLTCDDKDYLSISCYETGLDVYECGCKWIEGYKTYQIEAAPGTACSVMGAVCGGDDPDLSEVPEDCEVAENKGSDFCFIVENCTRSVEVADGVTAVLTNNTQQSCNDDGTGRVSCSCDDEQTLYPVFQDVDLAQGCGFAKQFCESDTFEPGGATTCTPKSASSSPGRCELTQSCAQPLEIDDGSVVSLVHEQYLSCSGTGTDRSNCTCSDSLGSFVFDVAGNPMSPSTCSEASGLCTRREELELAGPIDCSSSTQQVTDGRCEAFLDCVQSGTIGSTQVGIHASVQVACSQGADAWECGCFAGTERASLPVEAADAWGACTVAVETCPDLVEIDFKNSGSGGQL